MTKPRRATDRDKRKVARVARGPLSWVNSEKATTELHQVVGGGMRGRSLDVNRGDLDAEGDADRSQRVHKSEEMP
jgi:hypothetical protein